MSLLEKLLQENRNDKEAQDLLDLLIALREKNKSNSQGNDEFEKLAQQRQKELEDLLARQRDALASQNAENAKKVQEANAERLAQEAQRQKEEAERKAKEEELARKNKALQQEIESVNSEIAKGKAALKDNQIDKALTHFSNAQKKLPISDGEPNFSGSKNSEIASALYDATSNAKSNADKTKLQDAAVDYAEESIKKTPNDAPAHYVLGMVSLDKKDYPEAVSELKKATQNDKNNYRYHYDLGKAQYLAKQYPEARSSFQQSVNLNKGFAPAQYNLGLSNVKVGNDTEALSAFKMARTTDPDYENAYLEEARLLYKRKEYNGSINAYNNVLRINEMNTSALKEQGNVYFAMENYSAAENCHRRSLALLNPNQKDPLTYYNLSQALFELKKKDEALDYAKKAYDSKSLLTNKDSQANIVYHYALILQDTGKTNESISLYTEALKINPNHEKSKINLGKMYLEMNPPDVDTALTLFKQAYNTDKNSFEANNNLGSAYLTKKDYKSSIEFFQNALKIKPSDNTVRYNLAQAYASDNQYDNAKTTYIELLKRDTSNWDAYVELGIICVTLGDSQTASKYLREVQSKQPNHRTAEVSKLLSAL